MPANRAKAIADMMARLAGLQYRVENYLYLSKANMAVAENLQIMAARRRIFTDRALFEEAVKAHSGTICKRKLHEYEPVVITLGMLDRLRQLKLLARRVISNKSEYQHDTVLFQTELYFEVENLDEKILLLTQDLDHLYVTQHDNHYNAVPGSYKGGKQRSEKLDSIYLIEHIPGRINEPHPTKKKAKKPKPERADIGAPYIRQVRGSRDRDFF